jgi:hypothetical protein
MKNSPNTLRRLIKIASITLALPALASTTESNISAGHIINYVANTNEVIERATTVSGEYLSPIRLELPLYNEEQSEFAYIKGNLHTANVLPDGRAHFVRDLNAGLSWPPLRSDYAQVNAIQIYSVTIIKVIPTSTLPYSDTETIAVQPSANYAVRQMYEGSFSQFFEISCLESSGKPAKATRVPAIYGISRDEMKNLSADIGLGKFEFKMNDCAHILIALNIYLPDELVFKNMNVLFLRSESLVPF